MEQQKVGFECELDNWFHVFNIAHLNMKISYGWRQRVRDRMGRKCPWLCQVVEDSLSARGSSSYSSFRAFQPFPSQQKLNLTLFTCISYGRLTQLLNYLLLQSANSATNLRSTCSVHVAFHFNHISYAPEWSQSVNKMYTFCVIFSIGSSLFCTISFISLTLSPLEMNAWWINEIHSSVCGLMIFNCITQLCLYNYYYL
jgi:hypothetical protein